MASIVENIIGDRALQLGSEEFVRKMAIGNNWNKLRLGMRVLVNGTGDIVGPRLQMGVCSGDTNTFASTTCTGYVGASLNPRICTAVLFIMPRKQRGCCRLAVAWSMREQLRRPSPGSARCARPTLRRQHSLSC